MRTIYTEGQKIGECFFIEEIEPNGYIRRAIFKCQCGEIFKSQINNVKSKKQISCGCKKKERIGSLRRTHGLSLINGKRRAEFNIYNSMIARCYRKTDYHYKWYGVRGITVCERWRNSFGNFIEDMGFKPDKKLSLDRIDNDLGYSKENCKWSTQKEQCNNRRNSLKYKQ